MKLIQYMKNNERLYPIARTIRSINDKDIYDLLNGFYEKVSRSQCFLFKHYGEKNKNIYVYHIEIGTNNIDSAGFWAHMKMILECLLVADVFNFTPVVEIGKGTFYYNGEINGSNNVFEYYFEPVSDVRYTDVYECENVVSAKYNHVHLISHNNTLNGKFYDVNDELISRWADSYRQHIRLNKPTAEYIDSSIKKIIGYKKTLAVHFRGTDFNVGYKNHPVPVDMSTYIENINEMYEKGNYEQIFLATDDSRALDQFKNKFSDKLVYFQDVLRGDSDAGVHTMECKSKNQNYRCGLEVLRDAYALAYCSGFVAGLSSVSFAARYIKRANAEEFDNIKIISNGIYKSDSKKADAVLRKTKHELGKNFKK